MNFVYIVKCRDESLYTGWTNDLEKRIKTHNSGKGAKYTRGRTPVKLMYYEEYEDKLIAQRREREIKKLTRDEKIKLIEDNNNSIFKLEL